MRSIGKRKWIIAPIAVVIILAIGAVGAVALAGPGDENAPAPAQVTATTGIQSPTDARPAQALREARRARLQDRLERMKERWAQSREKMTPEDQAVYDRLFQAAKDQRAELQKARQDLKGALKQMRGLVQKYRPQNTTPTTAPSSQVQ